jgi:hypothetical protein
VIARSRLVGTIPVLLFAILIAMVAFIPVAAAASCASSVSLQSLTVPTPSSSVQSPETETPVSLKTITYRTLDPCEEGSSLPSHTVEIQFAFPLSTGSSVTFDFGPSHRIAVSIPHGHSAAPPAAVPAIELPPPIA